MKQRLQRTIELKKKLKQQQTPLDTPAPKPVDDVEAEEETSEAIPSLPTEIKTALDTTADFQILGEDKTNQKHKVKRTLPSWLEHPEIISNDLNVEGEPLSELSFLSEQMQKNLKEINVKHLFPVQRSVIPWLLAAHRQPAPYRPRDLCVSAPTGSGKTIAFALPIVEALRNRVVPKIRALIVLPVRELANQVYKVVNSLAKDTGLVCGLLTAKRTLAEEQMLLVKELDGKFYSRVDIVVATAGRLVEHMHHTQGFSLAGLKYLVIDEADRVMDQIQNDWLYHLGQHVKAASDQLFMANNHLSVHHLENTKCAHKLLFSATLSSDPEKLERMRLFRPKLFTSTVPEVKVSSTGDAEIGSEAALQSKGEFIGKFTIPAQLRERVCKTMLESKPLTLFSLIKENNWKRFLCFVNRDEIGHRLSFVLRQLSDNQLLIGDMSSKKSKKERDIVNEFAKGNLHGLICTDALARGLDYCDVDVVICYDCPRHVKTYIHRVGRTARAGKEGMSVIILTEDEGDRYAALLKDMGKGEIEEMGRCADTEAQSAKKYKDVLEELQKHLVKDRKMSRIKKMRAENSAPATENKHSILGLLQKQMQNKTGVRDMSSMLDEHQRKRKAGNNHDDNKKQAKKIKKE